MEFFMDNIFLSTHIISFPGLGIDEFEINDVAFTIFGRSVAWYGIIVTTAIIVVCTYIFIRAKKSGFVVDDILDYFIYSIVFGIIGARLYYVLFYGLDKYIVSDGSFLENLGGTLYNIIGVWNGGLAIYGGLIAVVLTVIVVSKIKKLSWLRMLDIAGHAAMLGQAIGRWGNFMNAEAHGSETDIFCRMGIKLSSGVTAYYHPTFLYESLWNIIGFIVIEVLIRKKKHKYDGQVFLWYFAWYGFGRMFIEGLRTDSLYLGSTEIRVSQLLAFAVFAVCTALLIRFGIKYKGNEPIVYGEGAYSSDTVSEDVGQVNEESEKTSDEEEASDGSEEENDDFKSTPKGDGASENEINSDNGGKSNVGDNS